jgi:hypothetical protein
MRPVLCASALLTLALTACNGAVEDTGVAGEDSADTGEVQDSEAQPADCSFVSLEPLVTSWNGGEDLTVTMECKNPKTTGLVLILDNGEGSMSDTSSSIDGGTLTATFRGAAVASTGAKGFSLEVAGEAVEGDVLRFRLDPSELSQGVEANTTPSAMGFGLSSLSVSLRSTAGRTLVVGDNGTSVVVGTHDELGVWDGEDLGVSFEPAGPAASTTQAKTGTQALMVPMVDEDNKRFQFLLASDNGKNRRTEFIVLNFDAMSVGSGTGVASTHVGLDSADELAQFDVILLGSTDKGGSTLTAASYEPTKGVWTRNWQSSLSRPTYHICSQTELSGGAAHLVIGEGSDGLDATWISAVSGKTLSTHSLKDIPGTPIAISSTHLEQAKGDDAVVVILTDEGGLHLVHARQDHDDVRVHDLLDEADPRMAARIAGSGNFRTLKPGSKIYFPPIQARGTEDGDLHVALSFPLELGSEDEGLLVASWLAGDSTVDLSAGADALELLAAGGRTVLSGTPGEKLTGSPVVFQSSGTQVSEVGSVKADGTAEIVLAADGGWTVLSRGGEVVVVGEDGEEISGVPLDPTAGIEARRIGDLCMLTGVVRSKAADGSITSGPGVVTVRAEGLGVATFEDSSLDSCTWSTEPGEKRVGLCCSGLSKESFVGVVELDAAKLPVAGSEGTMALSSTPWSGTWTAATVSSSTVFYRRVVVDDETAADSDVRVLAELTGEPVIQDYVTVLPYDSDLACPMATYFVPGASEDAGKNLASAMLLSTSNEADCSDLAWPEAAIDLSGEGQSTLLMSEPSATEGARDLFEVVWDGSSLLALPSITVPEYSAIEVADFDGDGLEEVLVQFGAEPDADGTNEDALSGLMLRGIGLKHLSQEIRAEVTLIKNGDLLPPPEDGDTVIGAAYELSDGSVEVVVVGGTAGRTVRKGNFTTVGVGDQPPPVLLSSWGAVLD